MLMIEAERVQGEERSMERTGRRKKGARLLIVVLGLLVFAAALKILVFPMKGPLGTTGPYPVADAVYTYRDSERNRKLNVQLWYPGTGEGSCPLVIYSHGGMGVKSANESLCRELASHGYVVCAVDHTGQCLYTVDDQGKSDRIDGEYLRELRSEDAKSDRQQSFQYYQKWMALRTGDIGYVLDRLLAEAERPGADEVYKRIDGGRIGVMGHSLGGAAVLGIGRFRQDIGAVIALEAPFLCDILGVSEGEFLWEETAYPLPVLNVYSDSAWGKISGWPQYAANVRLLDDPRDTVWTEHLVGVGHLGLTDLSLTSPLLTQVLDGQRAEIGPEAALGRLSAVCLEFFDAYLKD